MTVPIAILTLLLLALVVVVVSGPLRARGGAAGDAGERAPGEQDGTALEPDHERHELETAREAKYREIRDAEMDFRTGKLSREDYEMIDAELRREAIELLNRLERLEPDAEV